MTSHQSELIEIWRRAIGPRRLGTAEALAADIACYTQESIDQVLEKMAAGKDDLKQRWEEMRVDPANSEQVAAFYRDQLVEMYELAEWHSGRLNGIPPLNYAHAAKLARANGARRALDYGSGIGSGALCLAAAGCQVDCADISNTLLGFVGHRLTKHSIPVRTIDLGEGQLPDRRAYDIITCFDVLEHVVDQDRELRKLESYLRPGGYLIVNLMQSSAHPDRPMHISSAGDWLRLVRRTNLVPDWTHFITLETQALVYRRWGRVKNLAASFTDRSPETASARP